DRISEDDRIGVVGLADLAPGSQVTVSVTPPEGEAWTFQTNHTFSEEQIEWFKAGSALNIIRAKSAG
ncbi:MAG: hypothetical protein GY708_30295, partial [Actinomycetia bacterium]|nr:hypothetical protein [Actinomycetes bacterium]